MTVGGVERGAVTERKLCEGREGEVLCSRCVVVAARSGGCDKPL